jgi:hypothetical protein
MTVRSSHYHYAALVGATFCFTGAGNAADWGEDEGSDGGGDSDSDEDMTTEEARAKLKRLSEREERRAAAAAAVDGRPVGVGKGALFLEGVIRAIVAHGHHMPSSSAASASSAAASSSFFGSSAASASGSSSGSGRGGGLDPLVADVLQLLRRRVASGHLRVAINLMDAGLVRTAMSSLEQVLLSSLPRLCSRQSSIMIAGPRLRGGCPHAYFNCQGATNVAAKSASLVIPALRGAVQPSKPAAPVFNFRTGGMEEPEIAEEDEDDEGVASVSTLGRSIQVRMCIGQSVLARNEGDMLLKQAVRHELPVTLAS